jgi:hypothetical protein
MTDVSVAVRIAGEGEPYSEEGMALDQAQAEVRYM